MDVQQQELKNLYQQLLDANDEFIISFNTIKDEISKNKAIYMYLTALWSLKDYILSGNYNSPEIQAFCHTLYTIKWNKPWIGGNMDAYMCYGLLAKQTSVLAKLLNKPDVKAPPYRINIVQQNQNDGLVGNPELDDIIQLEEKNIKKYVTEIVEKYSKDVNVATINRGKIETLLTETFQCYSVSQSFYILLNVLFAINSNADTSDIIHLSPSAKNLLTNIQKLAVNSAEGFVFFNGFQFLYDNMVMKVSQDPKNPDLIHEYYIGLHLNTLRKSIPNFMYVYGIFKCGVDLPLCSTPGNVNYLLSEKVNGVTMNSLMQSNEMSIKKCFMVISQICLSLQMAYDMYHFVHKDLHLGNIMICERKDKAIINYKINDKNIYVLSDFYAIIIDYGFSSISDPSSKKYINIKKFGVDWMNVSPKPGIDLFKMLVSIMNTSQYIDTKSIIKNIIIQTFTDIGISDLTSTKYGYPASNNLLLTLLEPYTFLQALIKNIPDIYKPDMYYDVAPKGYTIVHKTRCEDIPKILHQMVTLDNVGESCRGDPWKKLGSSWKDKYGSTRYWFECGKYYFDGTYNVITFPKGMSIYHGSKALAYHNVAYPLGLEYFNIKNNWLTKDDIIFLKSNASDADKEKLISEKAPVNIGYYGDQEVAITYSSTDNCGKNCIVAFKLVKDATFIDLYDPFNIAVILTSDKFTDKAKEIMKIAYDITGVSNFTDLQQTFGPGFINLPKEMYTQLQYAFHPFKRFIVDTKRGTLRGSNYLLPNEVITNVVPNGYAGFCNPRTPYTEGKLFGSYRFAELVFGKNVLSYIERDFSNQMDWQYFDTKRLFGEIGKLITDFKKYKTFNVNFHQGDLYQHSVWVALFVQKQFAMQSKWVEVIPENMMNICIISGFLHDIGKAGDLLYMFYDKQNHPEKGFAYMNNSEKYKLANGEMLDIPKLLQNINIPNEAQNIISFLVLSHWEFGNHISQMNDKNKKLIATSYISKLTEMWTRSGFKFIDMAMQKLLVRMAILISVCDIMGSEVYIDQLKFEKDILDISKNPSLGIKELNVKLENFPYITNTPKVHRGSNNYEKFNIDKKGYTLRKETLRIINSQVITVNTDDSDLMDLDIEPLDLNMQVDNV